MTGKSPINLIEEEKSNKDLLTLKDYLKKNKRNFDSPLCIFPEGTTSNGRGLLRFLPVFEKFSPLELKNLTLNFICLKYPHENFSCTFTVNSKLTHLYNTCCQFQNFLKVKQLPHAQQYFQETTGEEVVKNYGTFSKLRQTNLNFEDKIKFLEYFNLRESSTAYKKKY
ncbi:hypothetical protein HK099_005117 [Clydaea vesicula]|uniref:Phospholipid/glycerol acyltransferase domain-containing protein n=1 Tax=Clydaea vesicula TaxID=447962 RepID=A0AAD5XXS7_9FUNG|nr:hypothetical protein HK099_005117 [Clydaea vesicula]KAJ3382671.1 hypothetical protein HDU92_004645 [Lobulomyces angularis]